MEREEDLWALGAAIMDYPTGMTCQFHVRYLLLLVFYYQEYISDTGHAIELYCMYVDRLDATFLKHLSYFLVL